MEGLVENFDLKAGAAIIVLAGIVLWFYLPALAWKYKKWKGSIRENKGIKKLLAINDSRSWALLGEQMRKRAQDRVTADGICDYLEARNILPDHHPLHLSTKQKKDYERRLGLIWPDLLLKPRGKRLKQKIADHRATDDKTPVNIPGPQPGEKTRNKRGKFTVVAS